MLITFNYGPFIPLTARHDHISILLDNTPFDILIMSTLGAVLLPQESRQRYIICFLSPHIKSIRNISEGLKDAAWRKH